VLTREQLDDLEQLQGLAHQFNTQVVIIGATALRCFVMFEILTKDVDLVVALDLEDFAKFSADLRARGWKQETYREHRWHGPHGSIVDLVPAGPTLRAAKAIVWPESEFAMSLIGFDHVFGRSVDVTFDRPVTFKVSPPDVIALLKIVAYMDDPQRRQKDLDHLEIILRYYEAGSERLFGSDLFAAELEDFEYANAFLLGSDVGAITTNEEARIVDAFLETEKIPDEELAELNDRLLGSRERRRTAMQLRAFRKGFDQHRHS
jgi:predicted nucleotidyltransferase